MPAGLEATDWMVSAVETPWHRLGTVFPRVMTLEEALVEARLTWDVAKAPVYVDDLRSAAGPDDTVRQVVPIDGKYATIRCDTGAALGVVGEDYTIVQNGDGFDLLGVLLEGGEVVIETAGSLHGGKTVWALARLDRDLTIGGDKHVPFVLWTNSHDGTRAAGFDTVPVRVVCQNTMNMALGSSVTRWRGRHTSGFGDRVSEAREALRLQWAYMADFEAEVERLMAQSVVDAEFQSITSMIFHTVDSNATERQTRARERRAGEVRAVWTDEANGAYRFTGWGVVNAFSTWEQWQRPVRGSRDQAVATSVMRGKATVLADRARTLLSAMA